MDAYIERDRSWIWLLTLYTFGSFIETIFYGQLSAFTPLYLPQLGIAPADVARWVGIITSIAGIPGLLFLPFWGALADRYARKPVIIRSFAVHFLAGTVCALAGNIWAFVVGRAITGLALGNSGLMMTTLTERTPAERHGFVFAVMNSAAPIGVFIGPLLGGPIVDRWGFPALLLIDAILMVVVILSLTFGYSDDFRGTDRGPLLKMAADSVVLIVKDSRLQVLFPSLFVLFAGWMLALTYVPVAVGVIYTGTNLGTVVGFVMGAGGFIALFLGPLLGSLADKYGNWRVLFIGSLVTAALWPLLAVFRTLPAFSASYALVNGVSAGVFAISFSVLATSTASEIRGRVMSFAYLPVNIGVMLGPAIGAFVSRWSVFATFPVAAVLTALGIGLLVVAHRRAKPAAVGVS
jgi:DHA1 family multidrug resistance protein-like MFS transporter